MSTLITDKVGDAVHHRESWIPALSSIPGYRVLLSVLFALWGMAGNLNDILIAASLKGFDLTDTQTALGTVDF
ncbi:hypothetical protein DMH17_16135, partial [Raoultella planticola]|nr:hypothetical protein [Raoultella planticola]